LSSFNLFKQKESILRGAVFVSLSLSLSLIFFKLSFVTTEKKTTTTTTTTMTMMTLTTLLASMLWVGAAIPGVRSGCQTTCLSSELKGIKDSLKELEGLKQSIQDLQHSVYTNRFFVSKVWKAVNGPPPDFFCPKDRTSCYLLVEEKKTWHAAQQYCMGKKGHLAIIEDWAENNFLKKQIEGMGRGAQAWWIGGTDAGHEGNWKWMTPDGEKDMVYHDWDTRQPDNWGKKEHFLEMWKNDHRWNDRPNTTKDMFICEFEKREE